MVNGSGVDFQLREVDGNANNGFELVDGNGKWAKLSTDNGAKQIMYIGAGSEAAVFTLSSSKALDQNYDFAPDIVEDIKYKSNKFEVTFTGTYDATSDLRFNLDSTTFTEETLDNFVITFDGYEGDDTYYLKKTSTAGQYQITVAAAESTDGQAPSDIDDLINYDASEALSNELDLIVDTDSGVSENLDVFDAGDALTGVATNDKTINALVVNARHRTRK